MALVVDEFPIQVIPQGAVLLSTVTIYFNRFNQKKFLPFQKMPFLLIHPPPTKKCHFEIEINPQRAVLLSAVTIAAIVGVVLIVSLTAGLEEEYEEVGNIWMDHIMVFEKMMTILVMLMMIGMVIWIMILVTVI